MFYSVVVLFEPVKVMMQVRLGLMVMMQVCLHLLIFSLIQVQLGRMVTRPRRNARESLRLTLVMQVCFLLIFSLIQVQLGRMPLPLIFWLIVADCVIM